MIGGRRTVGLGGVGAASEDVRRVTRASFHLAMPMAITAHLIACGPRAVPRDTDGASSHDGASGASADDMSATSVDVSTDATSLDSAGSSTETSGGMCQGPDWGNQVCPCASDDDCEWPHPCNPGLGVCGFGCNIVPGVEGCPCTQGGACDPGTDCVEGFCVDPECPTGRRGCTCIPERACFDGLECVEGTCR